MVNPAIELLENDIRRASIHVKASAEAYEKCPTERNYATWAVYQNILDKLELKLWELRR